MTICLSSRARVSLQKFAFILGLALTMGVGTHDAYAAGCNDTVRQAAQRVADARVAADAAASDQTISQPVSTMMQTCQNQSAGASAAKTGDIFSGDFMALAQPIVGSALTSMYTDFEDGLNDLFGTAAASLISGALGGLFGGGGASETTLEEDYSCDGISNTWQAVESRGIQAGVAYPLLSELLNGAVAGGGTKYQNSITASGGKNIFTDAATAFQAMPKATVPNFSNVNSLCAALNAAGITNPSCP